jgi:hypothetical protein
MSRFAAPERHAPWARAIGEGLDPTLISQSASLLRALRARLDADPSLERT